MNNYIFAIIVILILQFLILRIINKQIDTLNVSVKGIYYILHKKFGITAEEVISNFELYVNNNIGISEEEK